MSLYLDDGDLRVYLGHVLDVLAEMPDASVDCIVTSPPYFGLRDYGLDPVLWPDGWEGQHGLEPTVAMYVEHQRMVWADLRRVLAPHGTAWLNLGDSYAGWVSGAGIDGVWEPGAWARGKVDARAQRNRKGLGRVAGFKPKDLIGLPWRVAFALQDDGWWLRAENVWHKPNPMPESVTDRTTRAHESVFHLTRSARYWYDAEAVKERAEGDHVRSPNGARRSGVPGQPDHQGVRPEVPTGLANLRSVWSIPTVPFPEAHFAVFPPKLPRTCIRAGCPREVCRTCGVPRERIVERERSGESITNPASLRATKAVWGHGEGVERGRRLGPGVMDGTKTTGWTDCGHGDYRPGVVLDPFAGSGTTLMVAREEGRHGIGIEASAEYAAMIAKRTQQLGLGVA